MSHSALSRVSSTDVGGDWMNCVDWLIRCQVMTREHRAALPNAHLTDLIHALRDGVLLCMLVNRIVPKSIDPKDFSQRPQMSQFLCMKNIRTFLSACQSVFNMDESDLFTPADLFDMKDVSKVLSTLCVLSNSPAALASNFEPFSLDDSNYINLADVVNGEGDVEEEEEQDEYDNYVAMEDDDEDIYGDLVAMKRASTIPKESTLPKSKRDMVIKEIVDTEKNYVNCLRMLVEDFMTPLKEVIDAGDMEKIFNLVEKLFEIHSNFCSLLEKAAGPAEDNPVGTTIADCFIMNKEKFLVYGEYCSNLIAAQERLDSICHASSSIQQRVLDLQCKVNDNRFKLRDMLSVPMQRVLKYHLLLQELVRQTEDGNPHKKSLKVALEETQDLSLCVNEVKRDNEALNALGLLQKSITDLPRDLQNLKKYGRLQMDGELKVRFKGSSDKRHVFVLDQVMLICKTRPGDQVHSFVSSIDLTCAKLDESSLTKDWTMGFVFALVEEKNNTIEQYTFGAKKEEMRRKWMDAIKMAQENISPPFATSRKHTFVMWSFTETTICDCCRKLLRGVFFQGYRCTDENCKLAVHKECLSKARDMAGKPTICLPSKPSTLSSQSSMRMPSSPLPPVIRQSVRGKIIAVSDYDGRPHPGNGRTPLKFHRSDEIELLSEDGDWWEGRLDRCVGFFPRSHVRRPPRPTVASYTEIHPAHQPAQQVSVTASETVLDDDNLDSREWFVGELGRDKATEYLARARHGTYLVRLGVGNRQGEYALSINNNGDVKHMKIVRHEDGSFYLALCHVFSTLSDLVAFYQENSLEKIFPEVRTTLLIPYKETLPPAPPPPPAPREARKSKVLGYCRAAYDYAATASNQLSLQEGDVIAIVSKAGEGNGWWKGEHNGKSGYFPYNYVVELRS